MPKVSLLQLTVLTSLGLGSAASADTLLTDFNNINLDGIYGSWPSTATLTPGPDSLTVANVAAFGGGFLDISPNADATGETTLELQITVEAADPIAGTGFIVELVDEDLTHFVFTQFGVLPDPGNIQTLTWDVTSPSNVFGETVESDLELNLSEISFVQLQVDPGTTGTPYEFAYENLALIGAPPSALIGDYSGDGAVGQADLNTVLLEWGTANFFGDEAALPEGGPFDGNLSQNELNGVLLNWGNTAEATGSAVPEPATAGLLSVSALLLARRRRA